MRRDSKFHRLMAAAVEEYEIIQALGKQVARPEPPGQVLLPAPTGSNEYLDLIACADNVAPAATHQRIAVADKRIAASDQRPTHHDLAHSISERAWPEDVAQCETETIDPSKSWIYESWGDLFSQIAHNDCLHKTLACWDAKLSRDADWFGRIDFIQLCRSQADDFNVFSDSAKRSRRVAAGPFHPSHGAVQAWFSSSWSKVQEFMLHPDSMKRVSWAILGMLFLGIDVFYLTMSAFDMDIPQELDMAGTVYWMLDCLLTFKTGIYTYCNLEMNPRAVAKSYLKGWFCFDLVLIVFQWVMLQLETASAGLVRYTRFFRFAKLARLVKLESLFTLVAQRLESLYVVFLLRIGCYIFVLVCYCHLSATVWYTIGTSSSDGWVKEYDGIFQSFPMSYIGSMHWAVTQMQGSAEVMPANARERGFSTFHYIISIIAVAIFISKVTTAMQALQDVEIEQYKVLKRAYSYMQTHKIPTELAIQVKRFLKTASLRTNQADDRLYESELLMVLPTSLRRGLLEEARWPVIRPCLVMRAFHRCCVPFAEKLVCELLSYTVFASGDVIFQQGTMTERMYFIAGGAGSYYHWTPMFMRVKNSIHMLDVDLWEDHRKRKVQCLDRIGTTLCECVLWCRWAHRGDFEANDQVDINLLQLGVHAFEQVVLHFVQLQSAMRDHAARVISVLTTEPEVTDMFDSDFVMSTLEDRSCLNISSEGDAWGPVGGVSIVPAHRVPVPGVTCES